MSPAITVNHGAGSEMSSIWDVTRSRRGEQSEAPEKHSSRKVFYSALPPCSPRLRGERAQEI